MSQDGTTPGESFCPGMERLQWSHSVLGWNDYGESFCPGINRLQGSHSLLELKDSRGVILSWDETTPGESFCPRKERF